MTSILIPLIAILAVFYFFGMRPQKKQEQAAAQMRDNLMVGDEITTIGGIIGKIVSIKEETILVETGRDKTRIRFLKTAVRNVDVHAEDARERLAAKKQEAEAAAKPAAKKSAKKLAVEPAPVVEEAPAVEEAPVAEAAIEEVPEVAEATEENKD